MSLTQERLDELALEVAKINVPEQFQATIEDFYKRYARALLAAVEAELKPVVSCSDLRLSTNRSDVIDKYLPVGTPLISLPLIKEKP